MVAILEMVNKLFSTKTNTTKEISDKITEDEDLQTWMKKVNETKDKNNKVIENDVKVEEIFLKRRNN